MPRDGGCRCSIDDEVMPLGLARDRFVNRGVQRHVGLAGSQGPPKVRGVLLTEAHIESARAADTNPIAGFTKIMGQRRDEAEPAIGLGDMHISCWPAGLIGNVVQREALF